MAEEEATLMDIFHEDEDRKVPCKYCKIIPIARNWNEYSENNMFCKDIEDLIPHMLNGCIHCNLEWLILIRNVCDLKLDYYLMMHGSPFITANPIIYSKLLTKKRLFSMQYRRVCKRLQMADISSKKAAVHDHLLFLTICKPKTVLFVFKSLKNIQITYALVRKYLDAIVGKTTYLNALENVSGVFLYIFKKRMVQYQDAIERILGAKGGTHEKQGMQLLIQIIYHTLTAKKPCIARIMCHGVMQIYKASWYHQIKCGNINCDKNYLTDKYGIEPFEDKCDQLKAINKWYVCSGCKCVKYCSRRCQKISWNRQYHGNQCKYFQYDYKRYF